MLASPSTSWSLIRDAAEGAPNAREVFVVRYAPLVRAYLDARWRSSTLLGTRDDALQEVFLECLQPMGVLMRTDDSALGSFRVFLLGVVRNVARRFERDAGRHQQAEYEEYSQRADPVPGASSAFDRAWARAVVAEALQLQRRVAEGRGERALRRVELLRQRFDEGLPIREIAARWGDPPARVHREYLAARREFKDALLTVLRQHLGGAPGGLDEALRELRTLLA